MNVSSTGGGAGLGHSAKATSRTTISRSIVQQRLLWRVRVGGRLFQRIDQLDPLAAEEHFLEFPAAHRDVTVVAADLDLRTLAHCVAGLVDAHDHGGLAPRVTDRLQFLELVGPGQQVAAALEQLALKIRAQAETQHRYIQPVDHFGELIDLVAGQELGLVDQHAVNVAVRQPRTHVVEQVVLRRESDRGRLESDPGADDAGRVPVVQARRVQHRIHAALAVIVGGLQQDRGLARIHGRVVEVQFSHPLTGRR
jgi:hypothetical protein